MNLKTLDFDKLSCLPYKLSIKRRLNNRLNSTSICGWDCYNSIWNTELFKKIQHILKNSEGRHIDDIFSKISKMIPNNYPYSNHYILEYTYRNKATDRFGTLYINLDGIICRTIRKPYRYRRSYSRNEWLTERRRKKKRKDITASTLITILNTPLLFDFYKKLLFDSKTILSKIQSYTKWSSEEKQPNKRDYGRKSSYQVEIKKYNKQLNKIQKDIQLIENKDYTCFYDSKLYLYSIGKECPHFEQVIKNKTK